jgi:hypothetical protein
MTISKRSEKSGCLGRYKSFEFSDLKTDIVLDHRLWKLTWLDLNAGGGTLQATATIADRPDHVELTIEPKMRAWCR